MFQKKSLGQNFLKSKKVLADIVKAGRVVAGDTVLEIGPGTGNLTETLLATGAKVIAIEKDHRLIPILNQKFSNEIANGSLILIEDDVLNFDPSRFTLDAKSSSRIDQGPLGTGGYKLIANIPYYITGMILEKFLSEKNPPSLVVIMVQKEVAKRIKAGDKKESILSLSVKAFGTPKYIQTVPKTYFAPVPNVDSAILLIDNISSAFFDTITPDLFFKIVKAGFAHKRKQLLGNLKPFWPNITEETLTKIGLVPKVRAEDLELKNWKQLLEALT